ncbi:MAG: hypothetical protein WC457_02540 [Patescibacteria group bacterium]
MNKITVSFEGSLSTANKSQSPEAIVIFPSNDAHSVISHIHTKYRFGAIDMVAVPSGIHRFFMGSPHGRSFFTEKVSFLHEKHGKPNLILLFGNTEPAFRHTENQALLATGTALHEMCPSIQTEIFSGYNEGAKTKFYTIIGDKGKGCVEDFDGSVNSTMAGVTTALVCCSAFDASSDAYHYHRQRMGNIAMIALPGGAYWLSKSSPDCGVKQMLLEQMRNYRHIILSGHAPTCAQYSGKSLNEADMRQAVTNDIISAEKAIHGLHARITVEKKISFPNEGKINFHRIENKE